MVDEVEDRLFPFFNGVGGEQIAPRNFSENRRGGEVGCNHPHDRECRVMRIDPAEFSGGNGFANRACELVEERPQVLANHPIEVARFLHDFPLNETRIIRVRGEKFEIAEDEGSKVPARRRAFLGRRVDGGPKLAKQIFEDRAMQLVFVPEVVVQHRFIGVSCRRDLVRPGPRHTVRSEMRLRSG